MSSGDETSITQVLVVRKRGLVQLDGAAVLTKMASCYVRLYVSFPHCEDYCKVVAEKFSCAWFQVRLRTVGCANLTEAVCGV